MPEHKSSVVVRKELCATIKLFPLPILVRQICPLSVSSGALFSVAIRLAFRPTPLNPKCSDTGSERVVPKTSKKGITTSVVWLGPEKGHARHPSTQQTATVSEKRIWRHPVASLSLFVVLLIPLKMGELNGMRIYCF